MKFLLLTVLVFVAQPAWAYLDPGTGSMLLQVILGGVAAVAVAVKMGWHQIRAALGFPARESPKESEEESQNETD